MCLLILVKKNLNLNMIKTLKDKFKCDVGYSGHEPAVSPSIGTWFLGADYIEHITLDRTIRSKPSSIFMLALENL